MHRKAIIGTALLAFAATALAQTIPQRSLVALGDSLGEGVQSADANAATQPHSYPALFASQMGVAFPLPLIQTNPFAVIGSTNGRSRQDATLRVSNLAVSGADTGSILNDSAGQPVDDEIDLVEAPRSGTQIEIAQRLQAPLMICWIGNNDVLGAALAFDHLDGSQITPLSDFQANFHNIVSGLTGWNNKVVFANIPDVSQTGFLLSAQDLQLFLGDSYGLADGSYTSVAAMLLIRTGLLPTRILQDPDWVLDRAEVSAIQDATAAFNQVIAQDAAAVDMPVVDIHGMLELVARHPPLIGNVPLLLRFNGGVFSLDGVHPSDIGHALVANAFIRTVDSFWHMDIPLLSQDQMLAIARDDPFVDFDGDLVVSGRPHQGLLETLGPSLGISGDAQDARARPGIHPEMGAQFMRAFFVATGDDPDRAWTTQDAVEAMRHVFGLRRY